MYGTHMKQLLGSLHIPRPRRASEPDHKAVVDRFVQAARECKQREFERDVADCLRLAA